MLTLITLLLHGPFAMFAFIVSGFLLMIVPFLLWIAFGNTEVEEKGVEGLAVRGCAFGCAFVLLIPILALLVGLSAFWV